MIKHMDMERHHQQERTLQDCRWGESSTFRRASVALLENDLTMRIYSAECHQLTHAT